jgi:putative transposase
MTHPDDLTLPETLLESLAEQGLEALPQAMTLLLNAAMKAERQKYLQAAPYERTPKRTDYANGYKDKTLLTRLGPLPLAVPQVRNGEFYPSSLERGLRSERALKIALAEMYVQGVSTRKVAAITEALCGVEISSATVSRCAAELDAVLSGWRTRPLGACAYLYLDARYESVRLSGHNQKVAVLIAVGVSLEGKRSVLGVSVSLSEHEVHWRAFLKSLLERGLCAVRLVICNATLRRMCPSRR